MLQPRYESGKPCGNCIVLRTGMLHEETRAQLEKTLRHNALEYLPAELVGEIRIVDGEEAKRHWDIQMPAIGWIYEPKAKPAAVQEKSSTLTLKKAAA